MAQQKQSSLKEIIKKVEEGKPLTYKEEILYMTEVQGMPLEEAKHMITVASNKNPNVEID